MSKRIIATGIESSLCKTWAGWEGEIEWLYFYDVHLLPEVKAKCVAAGLDPDAKVDLDISMAKLEGRVITFDDEGNEKFEVPFTLSVAPVFE